MSASRNLPFLPTLDGGDLSSSAAGGAVVEIAAGAPAIALLEVAFNRLSRQARLLDELSTLPSDAMVRLEVFSNGVFSSLEEVLNLIDAALVRLRADAAGVGEEAPRNAQEGGAA